MSLKESWKKIFRRKQSPVITLNHESFVDEMYKNAFEPSTEWEPLREKPMTLNENDIKLIAFFLPQFHTFPENDDWWGKGFTEWTNVCRGLPQFPGHYQPRRPGELGFYDLANKETLLRQIELAKHYGITGFCFHHYWFTGKRLMEKPVDMLMASDDLDMPFCLCWPNESWTRTWDGAENKIICEQKFSPEDDIAFIVDLSRYLKDRRYIRIHGKPVIIIYRPVHFPSPQSTLARWRNWCRENGVGEIYIVAVQSFGFFQDPREYGYDAAVEFPLHNSSTDTLVHDLPLYNKKSWGNVNIFDYNKHVDIQACKEYPGFTLYRTTAPHWDNSVRKPNNWNAFCNATPDGFLRYMNEMISYTRKYNDPEDQVVFINAWNEWAEGDYLEPDHRYGYAILNRVAMSLEADRSAKE